MTRAIEAKSVVIATGARAEPCPTASTVFGDRLHHERRRLRTEDLAEARRRVRRAVRSRSNSDRRSRGSASKYSCSARAAALLGSSDTPVRDALAARSARRVLFRSRREDRSDVDAGRRADDPLQVARWREPHRAVRSRCSSRRAARPNLKPLTSRKHGHRAERQGRAALRRNVDAMRRRAASSSRAIATARARGSRTPPTKASSPATTPRASPTCSTVKRKVPFSIVFSEPQVAIVGASYDDLDKQMTVTGIGVVRNAGAQPRDAAESRPAARLRRREDRQAARRAGMRSGGRTSGASARVGAATRTDGRGHAQAAVLSSGGGRRPAHGAEGCEQKVLRRTFADAARLADCAAGC